MKPQTTLRVVQVTFLIIGFGMLVGALFWLVRQRSFVASARHAQGTVVDLEQHRSSSSSNGSSGTTYAPVVTFATPDGQTHTFVSNSSSNPPSYSRGESVSVLYDQSKPESGTIDGWFSLWGGITIVGALGAIFTLIGGGMMLVRLRGSKRRELVKTGRRVEATFQSVQMNTSLSVNGSHPFQIHCQWLDPQTSQVHVFTSENLWYDPSEFIHDKSFQVYQEPGNPKHYYMDISSLPTMA